MTLFSLECDMIEASYKGECYGRTDSSDGIIYAGTANMNPSIVVACVDGDTITVMAYAKEGLIKQKTAKKAIERFEKML